jgi:hypothetical protein
MPGRYDNLSVTISFMTQIFSFVSLLFVPLGLFWLLLGFSKTKAKKRNRHFTVLSIAIWGLVAIIVSVVPLSSNNLSFAVIFLVIAFSLLVIAYSKSRKSFTSDNPQFNPTPIYLIVIPLVLVTTRFLFIEKAVEYSRNKAIRNSEPLIQSIESHYKNHGHYPISLQALHSDYLPNVVGISQYYYEPNGNAYNLYFKQFSEDLAGEEIVMYNKLDEHFFAAHAMDILEYTGEELSLRRGDRRRFNLSARNWIYIKFD